MKQEPLVIEKTFNASPSTIWKALTDKNEMKKWYFDIAEFKPEVGFEFSFIASNQGVEYVHLCAIDEVVPNKRLSYSWKYKNYEGSSRVTFELFSQNQKTKLRVTHEGLETFPQNLPDFARTSFDKGWTYIVTQSLDSYLEKLQR